MSSSTMSLPTLIMALWGLLTPASSLACGLCREDNRAAVYSHEAVEKARKSPDKLEFVVLKVTGALPRTVVTRLEAWLSHRKGVDPRTIKIAPIQKSIGFVFERKFSLDELMAELSKEFAPLSVHPID